MIAAATAGVDDYAAYYGFPPKGAAPVDRITAPALIVFGEHEEHFSVADVRAFVEAQKQRGCEAELVIYPGASHGFFNNERPEVYHPQSAATPGGARLICLGGCCGDSSQSSVVSFGRLASGRAVKKD